MQIFLKIVIKSPETVKMHVICSIRMPSTLKKKKQPKTKPTTIFCEHHGVTFLPLAVKTKTEEVLSSFWWVRCLLEALFTRNFHCIATQCMTQFIRSGEVSIFSLHLCLPWRRLSFKILNLHTHTHTQIQRGGESWSCVHGLHIRP